MPPKKSDDWKNVKKFESGLKIFCRNKKGDLPYEAKIINVTEDKDGEPIYTVHYQGWNSRYDQKVYHSETDDLFMAYNEENKLKAAATVAEAKLKDKEANKAAATPGTKSAKKRKTATDSVRNSDAGSNSRATTPSDAGTAAAAAPAAVSASRAASIASDKATPRNAPRGRKRTADEASIDPADDYNVPKTKLELPMPEAIRDLLVDDQDFITRQYRMYKLPSPYPISKIVEDYCKQFNTTVNQRDDLMLVELGADGAAAADTPHSMQGAGASFVQSARGLMDFFDVLFGCTLLYKYERIQFSEWHAADFNPNGQGAAGRADKTKDDKLKPSDVYGLPHLCRLFVKLMPVVQQSPAITQRQAATIAKHALDFLVYLGKRKDEYCDPSHYEPMAPEYVRQAF